MLRSKSLRTYWVGAEKLRCVDPGFRRWGATRLSRVSLRCLYAQALLMQQRCGKPFALQLDSLGVESCQDRSEHRYEFWVRHAVNFQGRREDVRPTYDTLMWKIKGREGTNKKNLARSTSFPSTPLPPC